MNELAGEKYAYSKKEYFKHDGRIEGTIDDDVLDGDDSHRDPIGEEGDDVSDEDDLDASDIPAADVADGGVSA